MVGAKKYLGYIGSLGRSHGADLFLEFLRFSLVHDDELHFLIASRDATPRILSQDPVLKRFANRITVRCGRPLSTQEMNRCYAECYGVWNGYRRSTQSGVLPKAFMFGTPVLANRIGSFPEFVKDGVDGRFVNPRNAAAALEAVRDFRNNIRSYAANCRQSFLRTFHYRSSLGMLAGMLDGEGYSLESCGRRV